MNLHAQSMQFIGAMHKLGCTDFDPLQFDSYCSLCLTQKRWWVISRLTFGCGKLSENAFYFFEMHENSVQFAYFCVTPMDHMEFTVVGMMHQMTQTTQNEPLMLSWYTHI